MKSRNLFQKICLLIFSSGILLMYACSEDEADPVYDQPVVSLSGDASEVLKPGDEISVDLSLDVDGGNGTLIVNQNGGFLEEIALPADASTFTYTGQRVPDAAAEGEEIVYEFIVENSQELESSPVAYTVSVAVYDEITLGSTSVYQIAVPADGVVPEGSTVQLAAGRSYYLAQPTADVNITFAEGSTFAIEEGATVYIQSGVDLRVLVLGTVDIQGTAENPVVMTSEHVLAEDTEPAPGDWRDFQIESTGEGSNSGVIRYLRLEYGGERNFLLDGVGSGTEISHIQVWNNTDEAFFIGGGDANLSYLIATNAEDTNYRLEDAYSGNMQFIISVSSIPGQGAEAMYLRGDSRATLSNVTVIGPGAEAEGGEPDGLRFWSTQGNKVYNTVVTALPSWGTRAEANEVDGRPEITDINGAVVLAYSHIFDNNELARDDAAIFFSEPSFSNSTEAIPGIGPGSFVPDATPASEFDPSTLGEFFQAVSFAGAIENAENDWTRGWVKNPDGSIRE